MPHWSDLIPRKEIVGLAFGIAAITTGGVLVWRLWRQELSPEEIERKRRIAVNGGGKLIDGEIIDVEGASVIYSYSVRGVGYTAAQDVIALESLLPENPMAMIGPALVKFDPRNPANSIVVCEEWSGLHGRERRRPEPRE
jgi:hypothetical protein